MTLNEAKELASQCVEAAREAWYENFESFYNSGDHNREAVGRIANTLLQHCLGNEKIEPPSETNRT